MSDNDFVKPKAMTPAQVKTARALLGWNQIQLSANSGTSMHTVRMLERDGQVGKLYGRTEQMDAAAAIRATLETAGIVFIEGDEPGVKLRKSDP